MPQISLSEPSRSNYEFLHLSFIVCYSCIGYATEELVSIKVFEIIWKVTVLKELSNCTSCRRHAKTVLLVFFWFFFLVFFSEKI